MLFLFCLPIVTHAEEHADSLINGILSYVRWNPSYTQLNFCMIDGQAKFISDHIFKSPSNLIRPANISIKHHQSSELLSNEATASRCQILYFVNTPDDVQQRLINGLKQHTLTISEKNEQCAIGSAVCLYRANQQYRFKINMDSLKQSEIQMDSKVLLLSKKYQGEE
ncbi:YfiR family protein [Acinetobacter sp. A3.8]|uniref:YfiR family protein n=2 Tax=Acinetobacter sedimenti TaxID=2919922 RepID=A0A9X1X2S5_9GAMM|nr:YfiR family protein [Acinetobacter sedimenti]